MEFLIALSGAALSAAIVVAFTYLVGAAVYRDWRWYR